MSDSDLLDKEKTSAEDLEKEFGADFSDEEKKQYNALAANDPGGDDEPEIPYNEEGGKPSRFRKFVTKRKTAGGLIIGLLLGGSFGMATIVQGPLQFMHIAQLLQRFHFQSVEDTGNGRMLKLYKYAKNRGAGTVENTRLGIVGRKIAANIDTRYEKIGLKKQFGGDNLGTYEGLNVDPKKFADNAKNGDQFKGLSNEEFKAKFKEAYGITLTEGENGKLFAPKETGVFSYFKNRSINGIMSEESGLNRISGAVATRVMGKRDGITWHPIRAADAYLVGKVDQRFSAWLREQKERIRSGNQDPISATGEPINDENGQPDPAKTSENASAADATNDIAKDATQSLDEAGNLDPEKATGVIRQLTESTGGKIALGATAVVGLSCAFKSISDAAAKVKHDMVILPLVRMGMQAITVGNQTPAGIDMNIEQLGFFSRQLYSKEDGSWASARSIQAELGEEQTGPDIPDEANLSKIKSGGMFSTIINGIPGLGTICKAAESGIGKAFNFVVSLTTPIATILTTAVTSSPQFKNAIVGLIKWMAGGPIPSVVFGATYGNYINYGARLGSNHAAASMGGIKLTGKQALELRNFEDAAHKEELKGQSFAQRMFDIYSPDSLASKVIDKTSPSVANNVASLFGTITNPLKILAVFKTPFSGKASAAEPYDYGFPKVGFSVDSMNSDTFENPYDNASAATAALAGPSGKTYIDRAQKCFGVRLGTDGSISSDMHAKIDPESEEYDGYDCANSDTDWNRIRFYILDMKTAQATDCYDNADTESCQQSGFGQTTSAGNGINVGVPGDGFRGVDTSGQSCPSGSNDLGVMQVPTGENLPPSVQKTNIRLCGIPEIPGGMNVAIVGNVISLIAAARGAGVELSGSSFRTTQSQVDLRIAHCGSSEYAIYEAPSDSCNPPTAKPGSSMHEQGLAIDFTNCGGGSACFNWLSANAATYGLKNLPSESWHWSTTGN